MKTSLRMVLPVAAGVLGALLLAVPPALAQTTTSTFTIQVSGTASALKTGLPETVKFSGPLVITTTVVTDPVLPPGVVVSVDGRGVVGTGQKTGTVYDNECEARLTRLFRPADTINLTFAFFPAPSSTAAAAGSLGAVLSSKTGLLTLNLTYDTTTTALTSAAAAIGTL
ncbi:MAG TPA: hypothetical protein VI356_24530 [Myxococcales bacterium]